MGMDANGMFFYGMPLTSSTVRELKERDEQSRFRCSICNRKMETKFCPEDGGRGEEIDVPLGFEALRYYDGGDGEGEMFDDGILFGYSLYESNSGCFLYLEDTLQPGGDLRGSMHPKGLGKDPRDGLDMGAADAAIKAICAKFDIPYTEPQFYVGLQVSV